jgi:hypothetical protein
VVLLTAVTSKAARNPEGIDVLKEAPDHHDADLVM